MTDSSSKRMVALAIGISKAQSLPYLGAAVNGASDFYHWARSLGYEAELLTDDKKDVTIDLLRQTLESLLPPSNPGPISRFVLYFAGHGFIRDMDYGFWLLTDWDTSQESVAVEKLRWRLYRYGIEQIAIFADACRVLPADTNIATLNENGVLYKGPIPSNTEPDIDKFISTQEGKTSYSIPGDIPKADRCLFTGVLMEGLWGAPEAVSALAPGKVTSQSLAGFLRKQVPDRAKTYKLSLNPKPIPVFPPGSDVYFGDLVPPPVPPVFLPWPDPGAILEMGPIVFGGVSPGSPVPAPPFSSFSSFTSIYPPALVHGGALSGWGIDFGDSEDAAEEIVNNGDEDDEAVGGDGDGAAAVHFYHAEATSLGGELYLPSALYLDPGEILETRILNQDVPTHFETQSGFAFDTQQTFRAIWLPLGRFSGSAGRIDWWHVGETGFQHLYQPTPILFETETGEFLALTALPHFLGSIICDQAGIQAIVYRMLGTETFPPPSESLQMIPPAADLLARMESGFLQAAAIPDIAVELRQHKHADPTMGAICAYLYDSIGDRDSIRSMAYYYAFCGQFIPYDIAFLAQIPGRQNAQGILEVDIPSVPSRIPRSEAEENFEWAHTGTPATKGYVAGMWPWMRQGWGFLEDPTDAESGLIQPGLPELRSQLLPSRFATLTAEGGKALAQLFNLNPVPAI